MPAKQSQPIAGIRQACCLGLASSTFVPIVMAELRRIVPAECAQFTWCSETGRLKNFWSDTFLPRRTAWIILHHKRYEADAGIGFRDLVLFGRETGNLRHWWTSGFERSATYEAVFAPYGYKWFLDGVVRDAMRPYGVLALIRRADAPDFSAHEEELVRQVLPYLAHGMRMETMRPSRFVSSGRSAMFVVEADGRIAQWSDLAHRLAVYALVEDINLDAPIRDGDFGQMRDALADITARLRAQLDDEAGAVPTVVCRNVHGEFVFRGYRLSGDGEVPGGRLGILVEQFVPFEAHLLERVNRLPLSMRQREVVLLSMKGLGNADIAARMRISPQTLKDYQKAVHARLGVSSQRELAERLQRDDG